MTEDEAKTKMCCGPSHAGQRFKGGFAILCVGAECMAWRGENPRDVTYTVKGNFAPGSEWTEDADYHDPFFQRWRRPKPQATGYCGLAGPPTI